SYVDCQVCYVFFFQAEDGIRDFHVTGVQTCALPIYRALEPPDPIPNSEVKRCIADGSVGLPHVRVGHRQAPNRKPRHLAGVFIGRLSGTLCYYCPRCQPGREPGWTAAGCLQGTRPDGACQCRSTSSFKQKTPIWKQVGVFSFCFPMPGVNARRQSTGPAQDCRCWLRRDFITRLLLPAVPGLISHAFVLPLRSGCHYGGLIDALSALSPKEGVHDRLSLADHPCSV